MHPKKTKITKQQLSDLIQQRLGFRAHITIEPMDQGLSFSATVVTNPLKAVAAQQALEDLLPELRTEYILAPEKPLASADQLKREIVRIAHNAPDARDLTAADIAITGTGDYWSAAFSCSGGALAPAGAFHALTLVQNKYALDD